MPLAGGLLFVSSYHNKFWDGGEDEYEHTNNIFKEQYQMTPMQYLTEVRISTAKKLLIETDKDIVTICFEIGYESLPTFYHAFKNIVKMTPNKFRQQHAAAAMMK